MWNSKRSLWLSKLCTLVFIGLLVAALISAPWLVKWLQCTSTSAERVQTWKFMTTVYTGGLPAAWLLVGLFRLLQRIGRGGVFVPENVAALRQISWCCFAGAGVALGSALYYIPWLFVAVAAAFMGLVVRVVKNILDEAIRLKEENDYTI